MTEPRHARGVGGGRSLKTAAEALAALRILGASPEGITPEALAAELGKSTATARYLLNTLCQEGYAVRDVPDGLAAPYPLGGRRRRRITTGHRPISPGPQKATESLETTRV